MKLHWEEIQKLAATHQKEDAAGSISSLARFLKFWWCQKYNRPFKDPLLLEYTLDELAYEFLRHFYADPKNDPKKEEEAKKLREDDEKWIREQLKQKTVESNSITNDKENRQSTSPPEISTRFGQ